MRRVALPLLIAAAVFVAAALAWLTLTRTVGTGGDVVTEARAVEPFHRIELSGRADVTLLQGGNERMSVDASPRAQTRIRARVENGTLTIGAADSRRWWNALLGGRSAALPRITVEFASLDAIALAGAVNLTADRIATPKLRIAASGGSTVRIGDLDAKALDLHGTGALKATLAGHVVDQTISISGAADVMAAQLASENAEVDVSGAGNIVVNISKTLRATISGAGNIDYFGNPDVKQQVSGVGRVRRRPEP